MKRPDPIAPSATPARRGVALVITLLMLSVVTITAVAFLAVSRRERTSVAATSEQLDARYIAETALNFAEGRLASRISAVTNRAAYGGYSVSTNFANPLFAMDGTLNSFLDTRDYRQLTNVSYFPTTNFVPFDLTRAADREEYARLLGNLYYDPRPPVFVQTNRNTDRPLDFRYYLDLNRNGQFETNGMQWPRGRDGKTNGLPQEWFWGDPEWIGVLENPDVPHSGTNRFIGRFAYVIVPTSRTLDLNFSGNNAKRFAPDPNLSATNSLVSSGFMRNQGVGLWEANLAAFLGTLNTNIWLYSANDYRYQTNETTPSTGLAFSDAERLYRLRQGTTDQPSADFFYESDSGSSDLSVVNTTFKDDHVDGYSDGPLAVTLSDIRRRLLDNDRPDLAWSGSDQTNHIADLNDLFSSRLGMAGRLTGQYTNQGVARTSPNSSYDRYTFYRMVSQLGTDSPDGRFESGTHPAFRDWYNRVGEQVNPYGFYRRAKLNLNFAQEYPDGAGTESARVANFRPWQPLEWFTNAANRLLLSEFTNGLPFIPPGLPRSSPGLPIHGWVRVRDPDTTERLTNYVYDAQVHRPLQFAANIYEGTVNTFPTGARDSVATPSIFRPLVYEDSRTPGVLRLHSFEQFPTNPIVFPQFLFNREWVTADQATNRLNPSFPETGDNSRTRFDVFGLPWVIGVKKGLPSFNQALWQTVFQPTRRLIVTRPTRNSKIAAAELPFAGANSGGFRTEYQYLLSVTNLVGFEAWNAYATNFPHSVRVFATNVLEFTLRDETVAGDPKVVLQRRELLSGGLSLTGGWTNRTLPGAYVTPFLVQDATSSQRIQFPANITNTAVPILGGDGGNHAVGLAIGTSFIYDPIARQAFPLSQTNQGRVPISQSNRRYLTPVVSAYVRNDLVFAIYDDTAGRLLDLVTLTSEMVRTNLISTLSLGADDTGTGWAQAAARGSSVSSMQAFWSTNFVGNNRTVGMDNQMLGSIGLPLGINVPENLWKSTLGSTGEANQKQAAIDGLNYFLFGNLPVGEPAWVDRIRREFGSNLVMQVGYNPSPKVYLTDRRMANDPLVHYTREDLAPGYFFLTAPGGGPQIGYLEIPSEFGGLQPWPTPGVLRTNFLAFDLGRSTKIVNAYAPWGQNGRFSQVDPPVNDPKSTAFDYRFKDPLITSADRWSFPIGTNTSFRFSNVGELGRIHRGTPWQTLYLKSRPAAELPNNQSALAVWATQNARRRASNVRDLRLPVQATDDRYADLYDFLDVEPSWAGWAGNRRTNPTNDWKYLDLFTTAYNDNAARGQLGANQTNLASWSAVLSAVPLLRNTNPDDPLDNSFLDNPQPLFLRPDSPDLQMMIEGYEDANRQWVPGLSWMLEATDQNGFKINPNGVLQNLGSILQVPTLSDRAPFLRSKVNWPNFRNLSDEVLERVPQQILSLLRADEPRFAIYSYGQTLKPAPSAVNLRPGPLYGMATNYTVTGEYVTKTVLRLDGDPRRLQPVIEDQRVILSNP